MKFEEVLPALLKGKKIRRKCWGKERSFIVIENDSIVDNYGNRLAISVNGFKADDWETVKEKKKVKLRDLTKKQYIEYSKKCNVRICNECPLHRVECGLDYDNCWFKNKDIYNDNFLDQEVEINDDDNDSKIAEIL